MNCRRYSLMPKGMTRGMNRYTRFTCKPNHGNITGADRIRIGYSRSVSSMVPSKAA